MSTPDQSFEDALEAQLVGLCPIQTSQLILGRGVSRSLKTQLSKRLALAELLDLTDAKGKFSADAVCCLGLLDLNLNKLQTLLTQFLEGAASSPVLVFAFLNWAYWRQVVSQIRGEGAGYFESLLPNGCLSSLGSEDLAQLAQRMGWEIETKHPVQKDEQCEAGLLTDLINLAVQCDQTPEEAESCLLTPAWVVRLVKKDWADSTAPLNIHAMTLKEQAGMVPVRIGHPFAALNSQPLVSARHAAGSIQIPQGQAPGIILLQRQLLQDNEQFAALERMVSKGWLLVMEMDDDPHHWDIYRNSDFFAFRACHAVTVSNPALRDMMLQWNPNVHIQPNNLLEIQPWASLQVMKQNQPRLRVFFGALNRTDEWREMADALIENVSASPWCNQIECIVVHEKQVYDSLPDHFSKKFYSTLRYAEYLKLLATCHVALLPLRNTPFNQFKSDLKMIECFASGVQPICSPVVYQQSTEFNDCIQWVYEPTDWTAALLAQLEFPLMRDERIRIGYERVRAGRVLSGSIKTLERQFRNWLQRKDELELQRQKRLIACRLNTQSDI